jgi:hypothetical protein
MEMRLLLEGRQKAEGCRHSSPGSQIDTGLSRFPNEAGFTLHAADGRGNTPRALAPQQRSGAGTRRLPAQFTSRETQGEEDIAMPVGKFRLPSIRRSVALATVAAMTISVAEPAMAFSGPSPAGKVASVKTHDGLTDVSAKRRVVRRRGGGGAGAAAAAAAFAGIVGTGLAIAAARSSYDDGYYGGPGYYAGPGYYGGAPYYGGGYGGYRSGVPYYRGHPLAGW